MTMLGSFALKEKQPAPVTLPTITLRPIEDDEKEKAARFAEQRIIRAGIDAWQAIGKADNFENWKIIGAALAIGCIYALRISGANRAWGRNYSRAFADWSRKFSLDTIPAPTRSVALEMHDHLAAIEQWRATLTDKQRRRLTHPLSDVRRWRVATAPKTKPDAVAYAAAACAKFVSCLNALPPEQAAPLWQAAKAAIHL